MEGGQARTDECILLRWPAIITVHPSTPRSLTTFPEQGHILSFPSLPLLITKPLKPALQSPFQADGEANPLTGLFVNSFVHRQRCRYRATVYKKNLVAVICEMAM